MQSIKLMISLLLSVVLLSACKIEPNWQRSVGAPEAEMTPRQAQIQALQATPRGTVVSAVQTRHKAPGSYADIVLTELDAQGNILWQHLIESSEQASLTQLLSSAEGDYAVLNLSSGLSRVIAFNPQGELRWSYEYQDGQTHTAQKVAGKLYITGRRTRVLNTQGQTLLDTTHPQPGLALAVGLRGQFYVATGQALIAYDQQGQLLWANPYVQSISAEQLALHWHAGALYLALAEQAPKQLWLQQINGLLGTVEWQREILREFDDATQGPLFIQSPRTGQIVLVQSNRFTRQLLAYNQQGKRQWQVQQDSGLVYALQRNAQGELLLTGAGVTELYSDQGRRLAWTQLPNTLADARAQLAWTENGLYIGNHVQLNQQVQAVISYYRQP